MCICFDSRAVTRGTFVHVLVCVSVCVVAFKCASLKCVCGLY